MLAVLNPVLSIGARRVPGSRICPIWRISPVFTKHECRCRMPLSEMALLTMWVRLWGRYEYLLIPG
jgi:hypothetical protein